MRKLAVENLFDVPGQPERGVLGQLNRELGVAEADCRERPLVKDARVVKLTITLTPKAEVVDGQLYFTNAEITVDVGSTLPRVKRKLVAAVVDEAIMLQEVTMPRTEAELRQMDVCDFEAERKKRGAEG